MCDQKLEVSFARSPHVMNYDERSAREIVIHTLFDVFTQQVMVNIENIRLYRRDRQWTAVNRSRHARREGSQGQIEGKI